MQDTGLAQREAMEPSAEGEAESPLGEQEALEFAAGLLEAQSEVGVGALLGRLLRRVGVVTAVPLRPDVARALAALLRRVARRVLPSPGRRPGPWGSTGGVGAPGRRAGGVLGLELEGLSHEDQELEEARSLVHLGAAAARRAALAPPGPAPLVARRAAVAAARRFAPGLLHRRAPASRPGGPFLPMPRAGRWVRRGGTIVLLGG